MSNNNITNGALVLEKVDIDVIVAECRDWSDLCSKLAKNIIDKDNLSSFFEFAATLEDQPDADRFGKMISMLFGCGVTMEHLLIELGNNSPKLAEKLQNKYGVQSFGSPSPDGKKRKRGPSDSDVESRKREKGEAQELKNSDEVMDLESNLSTGGDANPPWLEEARAILRTGISKEMATFTPDQRRVLHSLLEENKNTLFVLKTGGGKSATYFVTTTLLRKRDPKAGPTIVISPLIALMTDQVKNAKKFGLQAATYNSSMSPIQKSRIIKSLEKNEIDIMFLSAEMLCSQNFLQAVPQLQQNYTPEVDDAWTHLALIVIDEVHCISEWGHDFRIQYFSGLQTIMQQRWTKKPLILGTSATVPKHAQNDIETVFSDRNWNVIRGDLKRDNLAIRVIYGGSNITQKINWIKNLVVKEPSKNILIFSDSKKNVELISKNIQHSNYYHALLEAATRTQIEEDFINGKIKILVSTNALSMGFDKRDIHYVIHTFTPASAIQYYQEIGRAGRSIESATAYLLHSKPWRSDAKRDFALRRIFATMPLNVPCKIDEIINSVADLNVPEKDANEALQLGIAKKYFVDNKMGEIILPNKISQERMKEHDGFTQTRLGELRFMKNLMAMTEQKCIWVDLLQFLGQPVAQDFKCEKCTRCKPESGDIRMRPAPENWKIQTPEFNISVYGLSHNNSDSSVDFDAIRDLLLVQEAELAADPPAWAMTYIPGSNEQNKEACKLIAEDLGLQVYEFVQRNPNGGSMRDSNTDQVRQKVIETKFILNKAKLPPPAFNILIYDDSAKSGMTMDKIASFLRTNNPERRIVGLVNTIWTCDGKPAPTKL